MMLIGKLFSWGDNENGQLGLGNMNTALLPQLVEFSDDAIIRYASCGQGHTCAISDDKSLYAWGRANYGALGIENGKDQRIPTKVISEVIQVACGANHTVILTESHKVR